MREGRVVLTLPATPANGAERLASQGSVSLYVQGDGDAVPLRTVAVTSGGGELALAPAEAAFGATPLERAGLTPVERVLINLADGRSVELEVSLAADGTVWVSGATEAREALSEEVIALFVLALIEQEFGLAAGSVKAIVLQ